MVKQLLDQTGFGLDSIMEVNEGNNNETLHYDEDGNIKFNFGQR